MPKPGPSATGKPLTVREAGVEFAGLITSPDESQETADELPQTEPSAVPEPSGPTASAGRRVHDDRTIPPRR